MRRKNYLHILFLSAICSLAILNGCGEKGNAPSDTGVAESTMPDGEASAGTQVQSGGEASEGTQAGEGESGQGASGALGEFSLQDINGEDYTQEMFADYDLTLVNIFATWCPPCIGEIPDLQKLRDEMEDQGVNVVGIVLDGIDETGNVDSAAVETAKLLAERTGASYPFLIPDAEGLNGRLSGVSAVPETFFVDKQGNIVGETYSGARSLEEWKSIVEAELEGAAQ